MDTFKRNNGNEFNACDTILGTILSTHSYSKPNIHYSNNEKQKWGIGFALYAYIVKKKNK